MASETTRWRDEPVIPPGTEDMSAFLQVARRARTRLVEFSWLLTTGELRQLRRAVHEWGSHVPGRYRCFDARVLRAINTVLGETHSAYTLSEPKGSEGTPCAVECVRESDAYRLSGYATFDLLYGYSRAGIATSLLGHAYLGPALKARLVAAGESLGWDIRRLETQEFAPVRNVLFGLAPTYGLSHVEPTGPATAVAIDFRGPFAAVKDADCPCLFNDPVASANGVYLWTLPFEDVYRIYYVGQTRREFGQRTSEHVAGLLSGMYPTFDMDALERRTHRLAAPIMGVWPLSIPSILHHHQTISSHSSRLVRRLRFFCAPLTGEPRLYDRVEGAIGRHLKKHPDPDVREFLTPGQRVPSAIPYEAALTLTFTSPVIIAGLESAITT